EGVYELQDTSFIKLHTYTNSSLQSTNPTYKPAEFVRTDGIAFDRNHNLFIANAGVAEGLSVLTNKGEWYSFPLIDKVQVNRLVITKDNKKWINLFSGLNIGIAVFDDNGTIENKNDDKLYFGSHFTDQQDRKVDETTYSSIAEDQNGVIWVGTDNGPITFSSAEQVQQGRCTRLVSMDERGEGYYPMEGDKVTAIAVDGANRKWIGTAGNGVHIVDQSGELKIDNLNKNNSPLISNNINSIAINGATGEVFFATDMGICSYMSDAIDGKPDYSNVYAYPNPVHPARQSRVAITGLMQNSTVKITDLAGNLMKEAVSNGGLYTWNCTGPSGEIVKAGVYLVFGTLPDGSQGAVTKIMVIR
ncbi:MAG: hypothetical protein LBV57_05425, partial [Candidatus Symbiothrix sp.]|nr:hypothetical protein [Candidatus Symbiothrix sp.]